jgi:hypothetical protein
VGNAALDVQAIGAAMRAVGAARVTFSPQGQVLELVLGDAPPPRAAQLSPDETAERLTKLGDDPDDDGLLFASSAG